MDGYRCSTPISAAAPRRVRTGSCDIVPYGGYGPETERTSCWACRTRANGGVLRQSAGQPALAAIPLRHNLKARRGRAEITSLIDEVFSTLTASKWWRGRCRRYRHARINTPDEVWDHPQFKARDRWREFGSPWVPCGQLPPRTFRGSKRAWIRCRASASTASAYWASSATAPRKSPRCAPPAPSNFGDQYRHADSDNRSGAEASAGRGSGGLDLSAAMTMRASGGSMTHSTSTA